MYPRRTIGNKRKTSAELKEDLRNRAHGASGDCVSHYQHMLPVGKKHGGWKERFTYGDGAGELGACGVYGVCFVTLSL